MMKLTNVTRKALVAVVAIGALAGPAVVIPQFASANFGTVSATTALNVRAQPNTSSQVLGVLASGEQVERRGDPQGEWTPIRYRGQDAWVFSAFTTLGGATSAAGGTATATDHVNVRRGASTLTGVIGVLRTGQSVSVTGAASGGWVPVNFNGQDGFIYAAYLSFDSTTSAPAVADPAPAPTSSVATGQASATTYLNVRGGPSTGDRILGVLATGESVDVRGDAQGDWTPVIYKGQDAWVASRYLSTGGAAAPAPQTLNTTTAYTTTAVNLRTGPSIDYRVVRVLNTNTEVQLTGVTQDGFSQVSDEGQLRWISTTYLASSPVTTSPAPGATQGPAAPAPSGATTLNTGGSSGLDSLRDSTKSIVYQVRATFPQITTIYGVRQDPLPDHPSGRAIDLMMPNGANDQVLGDQIAAWLQANANSMNIEYIIWRQRIWINGQSGWTWMADRGGVTANHYDHIHITVRY